MKISGLLLLFMLLLGFCACEDDDEKFIPAGETTGQTVAFEKDTIFAYKGNGILQIPMKLSQTAGSTVEITVTARTIQGTIQEGTDYKLLSNTVVFEKGKNAAALEVEIPSDVKSGAAAFEIKISEIKGLGVSRDIQKSTCRVILMDSPFVAFEKAGYSIPENSETAFQIPVTLTGKIDQTVTVQLNVKEGATAIDPDNYTLNTRTLTFAPNGPETQNLEISVVHNPEVNPDLALELEIISVSGSNAIASPYSNTCRILITNVETPLSFNKSEITLVEGETTTELQLIAGTLMSDDTEFQIDFWDDPETQSAYVSQNSITITIPKGKRSVIIPITAIDENRINPKRQITVQVSQNGLIAEKTCTLYIRNNDVPVIKANQSFSAEEDSGLNNFNLIFDGEIEAGVTFTLQATSHEGTKPVHYTLPDTEYTIDPETKTASIQANIGYSPEEAFGNPAFDIQLATLNGEEVQPEAHATVQLTECLYRKIAGTYSLPTNGIISTGDKPQSNPTTVIVTMEEWKKSYHCKGNLSPWGMTYPMEWTMNYATAASLSIQLGLCTPKWNINFNPGPVNCVIHLKVEDKTKTTAPAVYNPETQSLTLAPGEKVMLCGYKTADGSYYTDWMVFAADTFTMTKNN